MTFRDRLAAAQAGSNSRLAIGLAPSIRALPLSMQRFDDPFLPFGKAVIGSTVDLVCAYVFDLASYLALGAAGAVALERTIAYVPSSVLKILHGPFASGDYAPAAFEEAFGVDAVTLTANTDLAAYIDCPEYGVFVEASLNFASSALTDHPDQVGTYRRIAPEHHRLSLASLEIDWYRLDVLSTSVDDTFRETFRAAAEKLRRVGSRGE